MSEILPALFVYHVFLNVIWMGMLHRRISWDLQLLWPVIIAQVTNLLKQMLSMFYYVNRIINSSNMTD